MREFVILKQESMTFHEYGLMSSQLSRYAREMVKGMRSRMSLFVFGLGVLEVKKV